MTEEQYLQLFTLQREHCLESSFMTEEQKLQLFTLQRGHCLEGLYD